MKIRIRFAKEKEAKFISHLNLSAIFSRAISRLEIPVNYTEGFHTHPYLVFSQPLSLGYESLCEVLDVELTEEMPITEILARFQRERAMPGGIFVYDVYEPQAKLSDIAFARYQISLDTLNKTLKEKVDSLFAQKEVMVMKKTKRSESMVNIIPSIRSISTQEKTDQLLIDVALPCSSSDNLNPKYAADAVISSFPDGIGQISYMKSNIYDRNMEIYR